MKITVLVNSDAQIAHWQFEALATAIKGGHLIEQVVIIENQKKSTPKLLRNTLYYVLRISNTIRSRMQMRSPIFRLGIPEAVVSRIKAESDGKWEKISEADYHLFNNSDVVVKFGMGLLRDPHEIPSKHGVLSYHHGDPESYRGRPAGFWEQYHGDQVVGVIVQTLSNKLDGGIVTARAFSKVNPTSYKKTLEALYKSGVPLLNQALLSLEKNSYIPLSSKGTLYRLPSNSQVIHFLFKEVTAILKNFYYGAFIEKKWNISSCKGLSVFEENDDLHSLDLTEVPLPNNVVFAADPCGAYLGGVYCEILNEKTGKGEIARWRNNIWEKVVISKGKHCSYPQIVKEDDKVFLFPEIASWSSPTLFELTSDGLNFTNSFKLRGLEDVRLVDATLYKAGDIWFIFAGDPATSHQQLNLFHAHSIYGPYVEHPCSPIALDPRSSRMAGPIFVHEGETYRFAQNCANGYGNGVTIHKIARLSRTAYLEKFEKEIRIEGQKGPHTLMFDHDTLWVDSYVEKFSITAGWRRIKSKLF